MGSVHTTTEAEGKNLVLQKKTKKNCLCNDGEKNVLLKCFNHEEFEDKCTTPSCESFTSLMEISAGNRPNYLEKMIKMMPRISLGK